MLLFMLLLFPLSLVMFFLLTKDKRYFSMVFIGLILSLLVCAIRFIFSYSHRLIPTSFIQNFFYFWGKLTLLPVVFLSLLFVLISKDSWEFKISSFLPLMLSYYTISLPYYIISMTDSRFSGYDLFLKPVVYLVMFVQLSYMIKKMYKEFVNYDTKQKVLNISICFLYFILPAFCDTCFAINKLTYFSFILALIGMCYTVYCYFCNKE